ncbi:MAG: hypothetical protein JKY22_01170 [Flavobacteriaceae bacterium]|nr:hypothetical protein [Flavobacteriaceae bacterium]
MKTDLYTKTILTIIAVCLSISLVQQLEIIPTAYAADKVEALRLDLPTMSETIDVRIVDISTYDELNVNIKSIDTYDEIKVNIKSIDTNDELDVNIDEVGGSWVNSSNPIPVTIKQ